MKTYSRDIRATSVPRVQQAKLLQDGYNKIFDMFAKSKNLKELQKAVQLSFPIIQEYSLDEYQVKRLEEYGTNRYNQFLRNTAKLESAMQSNRRF